MSVSVAIDVEQIGVAGEVHPPAPPADDVADRIGTDTRVRTSTALVGGGNHLDGHRSGFEPVADTDLDHLGESRLAKQPARADRRQHARRWSQKLEGGQVQVIEVHV
jgi:hypothetical protein